jgi:hypothetical protein
MQNHGMKTRFFTKINIIISRANFTDMVDNCDADLLRR